MKRKYMIFLTIFILMLCSCNLPSANKKNKEELEYANSLAGKIITIGADLFPNPLSTKIINVWYYNTEDISVDGGFYFTFELDVEGENGVRKTVFYGNDFPYMLKKQPEEKILDLVRSDVDSYKYFSDYSKNGMFGDLRAISEMALETTSSLFFGENHRKAMQNGVKIDSQKIQDYFLKNY